MSQDYQSQSDAKDDLDCLVSFLLERYANNRTVDFSCALCISVFSKMISMHA